MAVSKTPPKPNTRRGSGTMQFLTQEELKRVFAVIKDKRGKALFLLAYRHGLRASEIGLLQRTDIDLKQGRITIHRLKGSLSDIYPLQPDVIKLLRSYLRTRTDASPYLFISNCGVPIELIGARYDAPCKPTAKRLVCPRINGNSTCSSIPSLHTCFTPAESCALYRIGWGIRISRTPPSMPS
jgi:integrase